jgi:uncharacterized membrane protein YfcA
MLLDIKTKAARELPHLGGMFIAGNVIGGVSSLVGIGGGTLSVPFLTWCNVALHKAVGTAAALGLPIALAGAFGYVIAGLQTDSPPAYSLGFVYLPAVLGLVVTSIPFAPLGAKTAHSLPVGQLRKIFALILYLIGTRMLFTVV